jgi:hypothetical protein
LCAAFAALCAAFAALFAAFAALCAAFTALLCTQCVMNLETHVWPQGVEVCNDDLEMPGSEVAAFPWLPQGLLLHYLPDLFLVLLFDCLIYCIEGRRFAISRLNWSSVLLHWRQKCSYLIVCFTALKAEGLQSHVFSKTQPTNQWPVVDNILFAVEELYNTRYQSASFSLFDVGSGFLCLRSFFSSFFFFL